MSIRWNYAYLTMMNIAGRTVFDLWQNSSTVFSIGMSKCITPSHTITDRKSPGWNTKSKELTDRKSSKVWFGKRMHIIRGTVHHITICGKFETTHSDMVTNRALQGKKNGLEKVQDYSLSENDNEFYHTKFTDNGMANNGEMSNCFKLLNRRRQQGQITNIPMGRIHILVLNIKWVS